MNTTLTPGEDAIRFAVEMLPTASEREARFALFEHDRFGDWLRSFGHDDVFMANAVIKAAAARMRL